jgi:hypothetical protein
LAFINLLDDNNNLAKFSFPSSKGKTDISSLSKETYDAWQILVDNSLQRLRNNKEELNEERIDINYFLDRLEQAISKDPYLDERNSANFKKYF